MTHTHTFDNHSHRAGVPRLGLAPIMGSLPRSLRPHDVVVWIRSHRPGECTRRRSLRGIRQGQGRSTPPRTGSPQGGLTTKHLVCTAVPTATTATVFPPPTTADCETDAFSLFYPDKIRGRTDRHHTKQHRSLRNSTRTPGRFPQKRNGLFTEASGPAPGVLQRKTRGTV